MTPTIRQIQERTSEVCNVPLSDILSERRDRPIARARQIAMFSARLLTPHGRPTIGKAFGRDQSTVKHALDFVDHRVWLDADMRQIVRTVCAPWPSDSPVLREIGDWLKGADHG